MWQLTPHQSVYNQFDNVLTLNYFSERLKQKVKGCPKIFVHKSKPNQKSNMVVLKWKMMSLSIGIRQFPNMVIDQRDQLPIKN